MTRFQSGFFIKDVHFWLLKLLTNLFFLIQDRNTTLTQFKYIYVRNSFLET